MKKIITFFVVALLVSTANLQIFSQKIKGVEQRIPITKIEPVTLIDARDEPAASVDSRKTSSATAKLKSVEAFSEGKGVFLRWQSEFEKGNLGFYVYRISGKGAKLASDSIVGGAALKTSEPTIYGENYTFFDAEGDLSSGYYIESVGFNGKRQTFAAVYPKQVTSLSSFAGATAQQLLWQKEEGKRILDNNLAVLPEDLQAEVNANALPADIIKQRWIASQPGVKIGVKREGIYRVTRAELQNAGFDVNAPGYLWQLYVDGKEQAINVGDNDSYIEFYGLGLDTQETDTKVYYLLVGAQGGARMNPIVVRPLGGAITSPNYFQTFVKKERTLYVSQDILNGEAENFFGSTAIVGSNTTPAIATVTFNLTGIDFLSAQSVFEIGIQGLTATSHSIVTKINGETLETINGTGRNLMRKAYQIPTSFLREGTNTLQFQTFGGSGDVSLIESIRVSYNREFRAVQNQLSAYTTNYHASLLTGFTSPDIRVFDLSFPDKPTVVANLTVINNNNGTYSVNILSGRGRPFYAVENSAILSAASITANTPSSLATTAHNADLIIVSYKDWINEANNWANYRRSQGLSVEVVDVQDIFDEFSYGSVSTGGMTQFFNYAKNNWQTAPNYILLLGDTSYDPRNYENRAFQNYIPTKLVDTLYEETGSDEALCDFNNDGLSEIAIGRIPARSAQNVTLALNKVMTFEANLGTSQSRGALFASDVSNGYVFKQVSRNLGNQLPASMPKTFVDRDATDYVPRTLLLSQLNSGPFLVNYAGHGSLGAWDGGFFNSTDANSFTNAPNYSLYFMLTCLNGYFIQTQVDSLSEVLLRNQNGGAVLVWASTGKTTPDVQETMATRFYSQFTVSGMNRVGDLVKDAKSSLVGGRDVRLSWALLGDPTLKVKP